MKMCPFAMAVVTVLTLALSALAESVYIVKITDIRKNDAWEIMTREEVAKLKKDIQDEARVFPAALADAKKDWDADELLKKSAFPGGGLGPRKATEQGPLNRDQAEKKKTALEERQADSTLKDAVEREKLKRSRAPSVIAELERDALRQQNLDKAIEKLNLKLTEKLKRDVPLNGL